ncbi:GNAT family N-acetyltransferase [Formosa sp. PL04]|uniref:GNAT family N-acetyltransferase n=1 Tax=Formosa sp. PL04 TaxID=3081755 RepID=UPI0029815A49|nr:GNAT family N-acetyltransferase [Formosa sp. PL04]MDW5290701.1 GNAT family N-acetyltransferase [Formosa sp. PL04]
MTEIAILTERLKLRFIELTDLNAIHKLHSLPETDQFNALGIPENSEATQTIIEPWIAENKLNKIKNYTFAIENRLDEEFIGLFGLKLGNEKYKRGEVWYKIHSDHWKKGYATEALKAVIHFGFENLKLHRIEAGCAVENIGSFKVLEKSGMIREGRLRQVLPLKSGWSDNFEYSILETDDRKK